MGRRRNIEADFWRQVAPENERGCRLWTGRDRNQHGHGRFYIGHHRIGAHRYAWELANGPIPDGLMVCHHCDEPACVNVGHLFLGTGLDNMRDMSRKGRARRTALSDDRIAEIRMRAAAGETLSSIADAMAISVSHAHRVVHQELRTQRPDGSVVKQPYVRLSDQQVEEIRARSAAGERNVDLASEFQIAAARVSRIVHMKERV